MVSFISVLLGKKSETHSDIAGGYGLLTRLLRDRGINCYTSDKFCDNLFAKAFEAEKIPSADVLLAFEVLEHIEDPLTFFKEALNRFNSSLIIFSTLTFKSDTPPDDWWYYSLETGQHISFYQSKTLQFIAEKLGMHYYPISSGLHVFCKDKLSLKDAYFLQKKKLRPYLLKKSITSLKGNSKTWEDFDNARKKLSME